MSNFVPIHCHTYYSTLDASASPEEYMVRAKEIGVDTMSITDHGTTFGHRHFQKATRDAGIKPILGMEAYHTDDMFDRRAAKKRQDGTNVYNHLTILAKNDVGLNNLNYLNTKAWTEGFYYKPRVGKQLLFDNSEGLIATSGCMSGMIAKAITGDMPERADAIALEHKEALGDDFYIEVMATNAPALNRALLDIADRLDIKPVMTSDCHYARKEDIDVTEAMLILATAPKPLHNADITKAQKMDFLDRLNYLYPDRTMSFQEIDIFLKSFEEEQAMFKNQGIDRQDIYANTIEIADKIEGYTFLEGLDVLPAPEGDPKGILRRLCYEGLSTRNLIDNDEYVQRLEEELDVIFEKGFETYFIIVRDMVADANAKDIRHGYGRGSGAGSLVNYLLGITEIDPVKYNLLFMRFLDAGAATYAPKFELIG